MNGTTSLDETIRQLREDGRQRAVVGDWYVTIGGSYALFEHKDDRAKRLEKAE